MFLFSIIIPSFNRAELISIGIQSIIHQSYENWEIIIVDDGSTDNTKEVVESFNNNRIKYIYQDNAERSAARNNGIRNSKGEWICFLDSDDEFTPNHLQLISEYIQKENLSTGLICTGLIQKSNNNDKKKPFLDLSNNILKEISEKFLIPTQVCLHCSILQHQQFDERYRLWEDTHLWLRITAQFPLYQIEEYTAIQHIHINGTVVEGMKTIRIKDVHQYVNAVADLRDNYSGLFEGKFSKNQFNKYIDSKYRMYLYQARQNKQVFVAWQIWIKSIFHKPSLYLLSELPKIFINKLGFGHHE
jgi:glycosyltransferase involved in cell wall biosynthesis